MVGKPQHTCHDGKMLILLETLLILSVLNI